PQRNISRDPRHPAPGLPARPGPLPAAARILVFAPGALDEDERDDLDAGQEVTVEAELVILYRGAWVAPYGSRVPGFTEYLLVGARLVAPPRPMALRKLGFSPARGSAVVPIAVELAGLGDLDLRLGDCLQRDGPGPRPGDAVALAVVVVLLL